MAYASIPDLRKSLPKQVTIGDNTLSTPDVVQTQGAPNTISNASALYYLDLATQHINSRLETLYFTPLRRIKQLEVLLTQNVAAGGDIIYVPDGSAFNVGCLIRIGDGNHTETHFIKEAWPTDPARMGQLKLDLPLQNAYVATAPTMVSEIVYPAPIPVCCARIAAAAIIDKVFVTEKAPDVPTGYGKCLDPFTEVLMFDGTVKQAWQIKIGDLLMGPDSKPRTVLVTCSGYDEMYRITPTKGSPYKVNSKHILSLKMTGGSETSCRKEFTSNEIINISVPDYLKQNKTFKHCAKGYRVPVEWPNRPVPVDPYFLGLWLGDGTSNSTEITNQDQEVAQWLADYATSLGLPLKEYNRKAPLFLIGRAKGKKNNVLRDGLRSINTLKNKHIPDLYKINDRETRLRLLAGIVDTDGHLMPNGGYDIVLVNKRLAYDVAFLAKSLGFSAYPSNCKKTCVNNGVVGDYIRMTISGNIDEIPVQIERKKAKPRRQKKDVLKTGIKVELEGVGPYCGWEIDQDGLFLLADFTVTHNSMRTLANNDLDAILNGAMRLVGQDYNGRRFVRVTNFDTIKSTSQFPPGQGKEI